MQAHPRTCRQAHKKRKKKKEKTFLASACTRHQTLLDSVHGVADLWCSELLPAHATRNSTRHSTPCYHIITYGSWLHRHSRGSHRVQTMARDARSDCLPDVPDVTANESNASANLTRETQQNMVSSIDLILAVPFYHISNMD